MEDSAERDKGRNSGVWVTYAIRFKMSMRYGHKPAKYRNMHFFVEESGYRL